MDSEGIETFRNADDRGGRDNSPLAFGNGPLGVQDSTKLTGKSSPRGLGRVRPVRVVFEGDGDGSQNSGWCRGRPQIRHSNVLSLVSRLIEAYENWSICGPRPPAPGGNSSGQLMRGSLAASQEVARTEGTYPDRLFQEAAEAGKLWAAKTTVVLELEFRKRNPAGGIHAVECGHWDLRAVRLDPSARLWAGET